MFPAVTVIYLSHRVQDDPRVSWALAAAISMGYLYQGPPFRWAALSFQPYGRLPLPTVADICMAKLFLVAMCRLSYLTLGEPLCFLAFGPLATSAFYLAQVWLLRYLQPPAAPIHYKYVSPIPRNAQCPCSGKQVAAAGGAAASVPAAAAVGAIVVGHTTSIILLCSHFHQIEGDQAAGKMSPLVRLGPRRGMQVGPSCHHIIMGGLQDNAWGTHAAAWLTELGNTGPL